MTREPPNNGCIQSTPIAVQLEICIKKLTS
jgi:hypothetical protein